MAKKDYESRTEALIQPMIDEHHFELVDVEWVKEGANWYLRVFIDKEGGITVDDCELISRAFEAVSYTHLDVYKRQVYAGAAHVHLF